MEKQHAIIPALVIIAIMTLSCRIVEVSSIPRTFTVAVQSESPSSYQLCQLTSSGKFEPLKPDKPGMYTVTIPTMDGGYKEFLFIKYNKHIPEDYPVIQIIKAGKILKEFSIRDIEKLQMKDGRRRLKPE